ncbi:MAG: hypothetical protein HOM14_00435 [Gammaproteobacteria bacterium]|jgi:hypothetical protein|nr:hypothetical protein [Gammaproteobacteria bacterium]MBT3723940.1 hypothetical protein [Gammaproteobacteria bacterium]MBT4078490.1 hypothetical protein [Gammaproteobacteria bacterium]MBT4193789.1 hypothetical protein [Gammaproteobacteria bacterium]MBT4449828.1 hypothetical protein [Gammaproteobacteria bacterium]
MIALNRTLALTMFTFSGLMLAAYFGLVASQPGWITTIILWIAYLVIVLPGLVG